MNDGLLLLKVCFRLWYQLTWSYHFACHTWQEAQFFKMEISDPEYFHCSIIDECGASIYSVSDAAQKEMPDLDPSLRGAGIVYSFIVLRNCIQNISAVGLGILPSYFVQY